MKRISNLGLGLGLVLGATVAAAGELYGTVTEGGAPVGEGAAAIAVRCGDKGYEAVKTDKHGSYHAVVAETGKCTLTVSYKGQSGSVEVASFDDAVQYDLVVEVKDGKLSVRRK